MSQSGKKRKSVEKRRMQNKYSIKIKNRERKKNYRTEKAELEKRQKRQKKNRKEKKREQIVARLTSERCHLSTKPNALRELKAFQLS